jgi:hypothetical protein
MYKETKEFVKQHPAPLVTASGLLLILIPAVAKNSILPNLQFAFRAHE